MTNSPMKATGKVANLWKSLQPTLLGHLDKTKESTVPHYGVIYMLSSKQEYASMLQQFYLMYITSQKAPTYNYFLILLVSKVSFKLLI